MQVDTDTMDLLKSMGMSNLPGVKQAQPSTFQDGFQGGFQVRRLG